MKRFWLIVLICVSGCSTFGDPPTFMGGSDAGEDDAGALADARNQTDATVRDASTGDAELDAADMGPDWDPQPVAIPTMCTAETRHIAVSTDDRETGNFDDRVSLVASQASNTLDLRWIETDGTVRGRSLRVSGGGANDLTIENIAEIPLTSNMSNLPDFAYVGIDSAAIDGDSNVLAYAGHNCTATTDELASIWLDGTPVVSADAGECGQPDLPRDFPNAWLPSIVGGYNPVDASRSEHVVAFFESDGYASLDSDGNRSTTNALPTRPSWRSWMKGTSGNLVLFPNSNLSEFYIWNPKTPDRAAFPLRVPGFQTDSFAGNRASIDLIHYRDDLYFLAFTNGDTIYIVELRYDIGEHTLVPLRMLDSLPADRGNGPAPDAVKLVGYPDGFALFYLEADTDSGTDRERWTIQPYRLTAGDVQRLECSQVLADFPDIDVHDVDLVVLIPSVDDVVVLAAVNFSFVRGDGTETINVEGAHFRNIR